MRFSYCYKSIEIFGEDFTPFANKLSKKYQADNFEINQCDSFILQYTKDYQDITDYAEIYKARNEIYAYAILLTDQGAELINKTQIDYGNRCVATLFKIDVNRRCLLFSLNQDNVEIIDFTKPLDNSPAFLRLLTKQLNITIDDLLGIYQIVQNFFEYASSQADFVSDNSPLEISESQAQLYYNQTH